MEKETEDALLRLLEVAYRDTGQSRRVAAFLLAWWNADTCGGFDLTDMWGLDLSLRNDIVRVFQFIAFDQHYPDSLGWRHEFGTVLRRWRPHLLEPRKEVSEECSSFDTEEASASEEALPTGFEFPPPIAAESDPDAFLAELRASAEGGDRDAEEFLTIFSRWETKFGATLKRP